ncbi:hypothetical protein BD289DRAFT_15869 [Coniella lustricola]|uniref:Transmembrane protein n=1 Tax=Coniella lustricola TaxID=2025994 RepID=A0A2T3A3W1_9PEZI|nr:hypothetical protein BD289DRAFT_15869 [Coniella lustricola]
MTRRRVRKGMEMGFDLLLLIEIPRPPLRLSESFTKIPCCYLCTSVQSPRLSFFFFLSFIFISLSLSLCLMLNTWRASGLYALGALLHHTCIDFSLETLLANCDVTVTVGRGGNEVGPSPSCLGAEALLDMCVGVGVGVGVSTKSGEDVLEPYVFGLYAFCGTCWLMACVCSTLTRSFVRSFLHSFSRSFRRVQVVFLPQAPAPPSLTRIVPQMDISILFFLSTRSS